MIAAALTGGKVALPPWYQRQVDEIDQSDDIAAMLDSMAKAGRSNPGS